MKILFYKGELDSESFREPSDPDVLNDDGETIEFIGTEIANVDQDNQDFATIYTAGGHFYITLTAEDVNAISKPRTAREMIVGSRAIETMFTRIKPNADIATRHKVCAAYDVKLLADISDNDVAEWLLHFHGYPTDEALLEQCEREMFIEDLGQVATEAEMADPNFLRYQVRMVESWYYFPTEDSAYEFWCINYDTVMRMYKVTQ